MKNLKIADRVIESVGDLPAMPEIVAEVLRMTADPDTAMGEVSDVIQRDPGLTAKILRVSNSPYYGMKQYVGTLKLALVILGVREVRNIVLGISVFDALSNTETESLFARGFWEHSIKVAALSKKLGGHLRLGLQGEDFIAGLLHDIGKMIMWRQLGREYAKIFKQAGGSGQSQLAAEFETFGFDHSDAATALVERWNLPETLSGALFYHHDRQDKDLSEARDPQLAALIRIANLAVYDDFSKAEQETPASCGDAQAWAELDAAPVSLGPELRAATLSTFLDELSNDMPPRYYEE